MTTGDIPKNIDCAELMRERFTIDSDWRRMNVWISGVRNTNSKYSLDLDYFETKRNVDDVFNIHSVLSNNYWLHERVTWEIVTPRKPMSTSANLGFHWQFPFYSIQLNFCLSFWEELICLPDALQFRRISAVVQKLFDVGTCFSHDINPTLSIKY